MRQVLAYLLYWCYIHISSCFPVDETPGFTPWTREKRDLTKISALDFSGVKQKQLGIFESAHFGVDDPTCRNNLPGDKCWTMDQFTVDKMIEAREPKADNCKVTCLFYTSNLSGAAERSANFALYDVLLLGATEGMRDFLTIWDIHDPKYYPRKDNLDATPETKCLYQDLHGDDLKEGINGCQRLYFMSMSKAMASQCSGEVELLTSTNVHGGQDVPEDGIWWQVEFPTLIDENRPADKKITKIRYWQVEHLTTEQFQEYKKIPNDEKTAPIAKEDGEYWPNGPGKEHLERFRAGGGKKGAPQQKRSSSGSSHQELWQHKYGSTPTGFVKRADRSDSSICEYGEDCYPYPYPLNDMYEWYKDTTW